MASDRSYDRVGGHGPLPGHVAEWGGSGSVALLVDDAHLLDRASAVLVHELAAGPGVVVIATVRSKEPAPDPILALWKDGLADRIDLRELSEPAVDQLLTDYLG